MRALPVWDRPTPRIFADEILSAGRPAVLRGVAAGWPLVRAASRGSNDWLMMLARRASPEPVSILRADPAEQGRFHYAADARSFNFARGRGSFPAFIKALLTEAFVERPRALSIQGVHAERLLAGFERSHPMAMVPPATKPRVWMGNASKVATHRDPTDNVAVVAAGRRRFTLFPPEAKPDLYMGPVHPSPAGTPISMVHVTAPDFERYPRFKAALAVAEEAELGPGDAIFIPRRWFHHVEALEPLNMLVNYWWVSGPAG